jgi:hypothetical protein
VEVISFNAAEAGIMLLKPSLMQVANPLNKFTIKQM